ncbi:hypothetical protein RJ640_009287 [Escallonia rubra]|uniref:RING-type domain-containing protein n=1 Tax=Escallonia rubra TaxID=112253 RepID=A0AA88RBT9_9ASTE|nr:hypothetical protein RJ640_009287 [Escallonia rubra]
MGDDGRAPVLSKLIILLIAISSVALLITVYHCITICLCNRRQFLSQQRPRTFLFRLEETPGTTENSVADLIPAHKYEKDAGLTGDDNVCAICLCEFEEGEELRTLPECAHTFHVPCIDMWLYSHPNCPVCRADASPSPNISRVSLDYDLERVLFWSA